MKHKWVAEHKDVCLSKYAAGLFAKHGNVAMVVNLNSDDWVVCDYCGALLKEESIEQECRRDYDA